MKYCLWTIALLLIGMQTAQATTGDRVLLELYTSQGCSSCPAADELVKKLADNDPAVLVLSFHVHYWDYLGWKDPFSSNLNTERQRNYAALLHLKNIFTPELIVNGTQSILGSDPHAIADALQIARMTPPEFDMTFDPHPEHQILDVTLMAKDRATRHMPADVFDIRYKKTAETSVGAGENSGRTLTQINNVLSITKIGSWTDQTPTYQVSLNGSPDEGVAIIVQAPEQGKILAAGSFDGNSTPLPAQP